LKPDKKNIKNFLRNKEWIPRKDDKCDYKPEGEDSFRQCVVRGVKETPDGKVVTITFQREYDRDESSDIKYPSPNLKKCGQALSNRNDCVSRKRKPQVRRRKI